MLDIELTRSEWSRPVPDGLARATAHHLTALARWLTRAGAEPRLALVLCSGPEAKRRLAEGLSELGVEVVAAPSTPARPVHPRILGHQGDHFNSTLYLADGFDAGDPTPIFEVMEGQRGQLRRTATWVALVVESVAALVALERSAPALVRSIMRRTLVLGPEMVGAADAPAPAEVLRDWRREGRVAELVFHHAMTPTTMPGTYLDFARLVRTGYVAALPGQAVHPERQRLVELWLRPEERGLPFTAVQAGPIAAEAAARHASLAPGDREGLAELLAKRPEARAAAGLPVDDEPLLAALAEVEAMGSGERAPDPGALAALRARAAAPTVGPGLRAHVELAIAGAHAALDDLEACSAAVEAAASIAERAGVAPELTFEVLEKAARLRAFGNQRGPARAALDRLEALAPRLASPLYEGRFLVARGDFLAPLDPARARADYEEAAALLERHGYPDRAAAAREAASEQA